MLSNLKRIFHLLKKVDISGHPPLFNNVTAEMSNILCTQSETIKVLIIIIILLVLLTLFAIFLFNEFCLFFLFTFSNYFTVFTEFNQCIPKTI